MTKELTIISGKGGCGKTTISASFAALAKNAVVVDADVDAADMHLLLKPDILETKEFTGLDVAEKDDEKCINCGACYENCKYGSFDPDNTLHQDKCEGCAVCTIVCPVNAIKMVRRVSGETHISKTRFGTMVHARLKPGEEASGKLVAEVRKMGKEVAQDEKKDMIIIDGPPGTGCTVIASLTGVDLALIVIEPSLSGIHDSKRVIDVAKHFNVPTLVCINKYDINNENTKAIEDFCKEEGIEMVGKLSYDDIATKAMMDEKTVVEFSEGPFAKSIVDMWNTVENKLMGKSE